MITVSVIDDDVNVRKGLRWLLNNLAGLSCLATYTNYAEANEGLREEIPDILLLDISLPGVSGIEAIQPIRKRFPTVKIIMHSNFDEDDKIFHSKQAGAAGYVLKNASAAWLHRAILKIEQGGSVWPLGYTENVSPKHPVFPDSFLQKISTLIQIVRKRFTN